MHETASVAGDLLADLDRVVHEPARLLIVSQLYVIESSDFLFLQQQTGMTQGNLSSHIAKLENAGYVTVEKTFVGKRPKTLLQLTEAGRTAFERYAKSVKPLLELAGD